jgi:hypothetical protein
MKAAVIVLSGVVASAFALGTASAEPVRVKLTARISEINDPNVALHGRLVIGQRVTGVYVYNTNTPNESPFPGSGLYRPFAGEARMRFATGSLVFESAQPTQGIMIGTFPQNEFSSGQFFMDSNDNKVLTDGTVVNNIHVEFAGQGNVTQSLALPAAAPELTAYFTREVVLSGNSAGSSFQVRAQVEASELVVTPALEVSPAAGAFVPGQHFDAALLLPRGSVVANAHALAGGTVLPLSYPGSCQLLAPNSEGKPGLLCAGTDAVLPIAAGAPIEWTVELTNGTILTETVDWQLH